MTEEEKVYEDLLTAMKRNPIFEGAVFRECDAPGYGRVIKEIEIHMPGYELVLLITPEELRERLRRNVEMPPDYLANSIGKEIQRDNELICNQMKRLKQSGLVVLTSAVASYEENREWLQHIPHERIADLAVYVKSDLGYHAYVQVNDELLSDLHLTKEEALKKAKETMQKIFCFRTYRDMMMERLFKDDADDEKIREFERTHPPNWLWVLSTEDNHDGASLIACPEILKKIYDKLGGRYYILPLSVHQLLIVSKRDEAEKDALHKTILDMDNGKPRDRDWLSDNIYEFDGKKLKIAGTITEVREKLPGISRESRHIR